MDARPSATVAAVIERGGHFLLVEEEDDGRIVFNQPAGHLELNESLVEGCARERHRSPLVLRCVEDYLAGRRYPLEILSEYA